MEEVLAEGFDPADFPKIEIGPTWQFKPDSQRVGEDEQWYSEAVSDADWGQLQSGQHWNSQGHANYHGSAWYRTHLTMPADFDSREHLWLVFGAVDKEAFVYMDGKKVFEHSSAVTGKRADELWDMPFRFDARPYLTADREHLIAVKVRSETHNGGIWRPAWLVSGDTEVPVALLSGLVDEPTTFRFEKGSFPRRARASPPRPP